MIFHTERFADTADVQKMVSAKAIAALPARFAALESFLGDKDWFIGHKHPTIVDAYFYGVVRAGDEFLDVGAYKGLTKLRERLAKDHAVIFAQAMEDNTPSPKSNAYQGDVELNVASSH